MNLKTRLEERIIVDGGRIAIQYKKNDEWPCITYDELGSKIKGLTRLIRGDIEKGDRVGIILENRPEWPVIFFAAVSSGAVVVPVGAEAAEKDAENLFRAADCRIIFKSQNISLSTENLPAVKKIINCTEFFFDEIESAADVSAFDSAVEITRNDLACILYTSGTTDEPKGAMLTHGNLLSNADSLYKVGVVTENDSILSILPLHHIFPLTVTMLLALIYGGKVVYPGSMRAEVIQEAMARTRPTVFVAVPEIYHLFHRKMLEGMARTPFPLKMILNLLTEFFYFLRNSTGINLSRYLYAPIHRKFGGSMRILVSGGAKLDESVERDLFRFGFTILEGYGLTETSPVLTINPMSRPKIGSVGRPIPGVEIDIFEKDEKGAGEVIARGPNIMKGYYKRDDFTKEAIMDGWFHTGDLGFMDKDGYLFLTGRSKEIIVLSSGLNINPLEIEEAYMREAPVKEMCVIEAPAKTGGRETLCLWAVVRPDLEFFRKYGEVNLRSVIKERFDNVSRTLPAHKRIMGFSITLKDFPRTLLGKMKRFEIKKIYTGLIDKAKPYIAQEKKLSEEDKKLMQTPTGKIVIECLKKAVKATNTISPDDTLELDLGIDSLGRIELASSLEKAFKASVKDESVGRAFTVRDLINNVESSIKEGRETIKPAGEKESREEPDYWKKLFEVPPREENLEKIDLKPNFLAWLGGFIFTLIWYVHFKVFHRLKVEGHENYPPRGAYIFYVNHTSYYDGLIVASALPHFPRLDLFFIGFRPYFNVAVIRSLIRIGRIIPLDFASHLLEALRSAYYALKNGKKLCVFPEGMRTLDGKIKEFKKGFGILVKESGAPLVPVILDGVFEAWPRTSKFPHFFKPIKVRFGKALDTAELEKEGFKMGAPDSYSAITIAARKRLIDFKNRR